MTTEPAPTRILVPARIDGLNLRAAVGEPLEFMLAVDEDSIWRARGIDPDFSLANTPAPDGYQGFAVVAQIVGRHVVVFVRHRPWDLPDTPAVHSIAVEIHAV